MSSKKQKLEPTWTGKDVRPRLEPLILLENLEHSYHAGRRVTSADFFDNRLILGGNLLALTALAEDVGEGRSLLVCCSAFRGITAAQASQRWPQLTVKKLPKMVLSRCEWGHDDYSLNVANLPMAEKPVAEPKQAGLFGDEGEAGA